MANVSQRDALADSIRKAWPTGEWDAAETDRAKELADLLLKQGITNISDIKITDKSTKSKPGGYYTGNYSDSSEPVWNEDPNYEVETPKSQVTIGGKTVGYLGDYNTDGSYGNKASEYMDGKPTDMPMIAWSSRGHGNVTYQVRPNPDGKSLGIYPVWGSSSDMGTVRDVVKAVAIMAAIAYGGAALAGTGSAAGGAGAAAGAAGEAGAIGAGAAAGGTAAGGIGAAEAAAALAGVEGAAGGAAVASAVEGAALATGATAAEATALGTAAATGGATQTIVITGVKAGWTAAEIAAAVKAVAPVAAAAINAASSSSAPTSEGSNVNEDYSNEGRNYPTQESTQGSSGSPVNSSTSGSNFTLKDAKNYYDVIKGVMGIVQGGKQADMGEAAVQLGLAKQAEADRLVKDALAKIEALTPPDLMAIAKPLKEQVFLGVLTPEQYVAELQKASELNNIKLDPAVTAAQYDALNQFKEIADNKGLTPGDRAQLAEIASQEAMKARGARDALTQQAQQRGVGGSGIDMVSQMIANQGAASDASSRGNQVAIDAQKRALSALQSQADLSTRMNNDSFNQQAQVATAQDAINRYNNNLVNTANFANVDKRNAAEKDAREKQYQVNRDNSELQYKTQQQQLDAANQDYKNKYGKAATYADVASRYASDLNKTGQATSAAGAVQQSQGDAARYDAYGRLIEKAATSETAQKAYGAIGNYIADWWSDKNLKTNVKEVKPDEDIDELLDALTGYKYSYKKKAQPRMGTDEYQGVMAQDLEKSKLGSEMVSEGEEGKQVDSKKAMEAALVALKRMNARLSKLEG